MATCFAYVHRTAFPSARAVEIPDRGHFVLAEDPDIVAAHDVPIVCAHMLGARAAGGSARA